MPDSTSEELPEGYFEVESIVDGRKTRGKWEFLVKWVGYEHSENSWVFEDDFGTDCLQMIREWKTKQKQPKKAKPDRAQPVSRSKRSLKRVASSSSSSEPTDSLSDDNVPLSNRLRTRRASNKQFSESRKSSGSRKSGSRGLIRMDSIEDMGYSTPEAMSIVEDEETERESYSGGPAQMDTVSTEALDAAKGQALDFSKSVEVDVEIVENGPDRVEESATEEIRLPDAAVSAPESIAEHAIKNEAERVIKTEDLKMVEERMESVQLPSDEPVQESAAVQKDTVPDEEASLPDTIIPLQTEIPEPIQTNLPESVQFKIPEPVQARDPEPVQTRLPEPANLDRLDEAVVQQRDPNADLLEESVLWRELVPENRFPASVSEICSMMGDLDERERIQLIDHLTFRFGHTEMFVLISTQRSFLRKFEDWLIEAYKSGSPMSIAFIRSALTLMSVFPGNKYSNYRRLIRVIREWFVVDPVCTNLAGRLLKQWEYHRDISQGRTPSTSNSVSPTNAFSDSSANVTSTVSLDPGQSIPTPVRLPPRPSSAIAPTPPRAPVPVAASPVPPPVSVNVATYNGETLKSSPDISTFSVSPHLETSLASANIEPNATKMDIVEESPTNMDVVPPPSEDSSIGVIAPDSSLNQVVIVQDSSATFVPAGIDDDLEYPGDDDPAWITPVPIP